MTQPIPVEYVFPANLRSQDFHWIGTANRASPRFTQLQAEDIYNKLKTGQAHLLRMLPPNEGVLLLEVVENNDVRRLLLLAVAGVGIARLATSLARLLIITAAEWQCSAVETLVVDPRLARAIVRAGARPESVTLVLEVES